jgi:multisubunit Na+/H+ antiporter MnhB subunit
MPTTLTKFVARLLLLPMFIIALAVLVKGYSDTGDGFSAGMIAAFGVLLQYLAAGAGDVEGRLYVRAAPWLAFGGLLLALLIAFVPVALGQPIMAHVPAHGGEVTHLGTLEVHTAVAFDTGIFLLVYGFTVRIIHVIARLSRQEEP